MQSLGATLGRGAVDPRRSRQSLRVTGVMRAFRTLPNALRGTADPGAVIAYVPGIFPFQINS